MDVLAEGDEHNVRMESIQEFDDHDISCYDTVKYCGFYELSYFATFLSIFLKFRDKRVVKIICIEFG